MAGLRDLPDKRDTPESRIEPEKIVEAAAKPVPGLDGIARDRVPPGTSIDAVGDRTQARLVEQGYKAVGPDRVYRWIRGPAWTGPATGDDMLEFLQNNPDGEIVTGPNGEMVHNRDAVLASIPRAVQDEIDARENARAAEFGQWLESNSSEDITHTPEGEEFSLMDKAQMLRVRAQSKESIARQLMDSPTQGKTLEEAAAGKSSEDIFGAGLEYALRNRPAAVEKAVAQYDAENRKDAAFEQLKKHAKGRIGSYAFPNNPLAKK